MPNCALCGEPMPDGEEMFKYHGYSGECPKPPKPKVEKPKGFDWNIQVEAADLGPQLSRSLAAWLSSDMTLESPEHIALKNLLWDNKGMISKIINAYADQN